MKSLYFKKIDAFATKNSNGNPAGYIKLKKQSQLSKADKLKIGKELKGFVSEIGFISKKSKRKYELQYFSSEMEVDFCGHATIAIMYDLFSETESLKMIKSITIITNKGELLVQNRLKIDNSVFIMAPKPIYLDNDIDVKDIAINIGINDDDINFRFPISIINAGLTTLLIPIKALSTMMKIK
jgi:PhzF family phenazine biosynthesis protein